MLWTKNHGRRTADGTRRTDIWITKSLPELSSGETKNYVYHINVRTLLSCTESWDIASPNSYTFLSRVYGFCCPSQSSRGISTFTRVHLFLSLMILNIMHHVHACNRVLEVRRGLMVSTVLFPSTSLKDRVIKALELCSCGKEKKSSRGIQGRNRHIFLRGQSHFFGFFFSRREMFFPGTKFPFW